jgi:hypothetical protein
MAKAKLTKGLVRKATKLNKEISKAELRQAATNLGRVNSSLGGKSVAKTKPLRDKVAYGVAKATARATAAGIKPKKSAKIVKSSTKSGGR